MSLRGYVKRGKPANWLGVVGAKPVRGRDSFPTNVTALSILNSLSPLPRKRINPVSKRRQSSSRAYVREARQFVAEAKARGETCPVLAAFNLLPKEMQAVLTVPWTGNKRSNELTENHHRCGRRGRLLMWKPGWIAMSKFGHRSVHMFPAEARKHGWFGEVGSWNNEKLVDAQSP